MNGKKAKLLRSLAGVNKETRKDVGYQVKEGTTKNRSIFHPELLNADGTPLVMGTITTSTLELAQGSRLLYKTLKKGLARKLRSIGQSGKSSMGARV